MLSQVYYCLVKPIEIDPVEIEPMDRPRRGVKSPEGVSVLALA
jgi:hypothetical protein